MAAIPRQAALTGSVLRAHARPALCASKGLVTPLPSLTFASASYSSPARLSPARQGVTFADRRWSSSSDKPPVDKGDLVGPLSEVKDWTFEDIQEELGRKKSGGSGKVVFVDVREPSELKETGWIPGAINIPITSAVQSFHLPPEDFKDMLGYERPLPRTPIVVYCKAGVRARAAAGLAVHAGFQDVGIYKGSWLDWVKKEGPVSRQTKHYRLAEEQPAAQVQNYDTPPSPRVSVRDNEPVSDAHGKFAKGGARSYLKTGTPLRSARELAGRSPGHEKKDKEEDLEDEFSEKFDSRRRR